MTKSLLNNPQIELNISKNTKIIMYTNRLHAVYITNHLLTYKNTFPHQ